MHTEVYPLTIMTEFTRRHFLKRTGTAGLAFAVSSATVGNARAADASITGRLITHKGDPIADRVVKNYGENSFTTYTDEKGRFSADTEPGSRLYLTLYKGTRSTLVDPVQNGVPHVFLFEKRTASDGETDLGEIRLPQAYRVRLRALDSDGDPVANSSPEIRHEGAGIGESYIDTKSDGWAYINGADFDGIELAGNVKLGMAIPSGSGGETSYDTNLSINEATTAVFQLEEGVTVRESSTTPVDTETTTKTEQPVTSTPTPTATPTASKTETVTAGTPGTEFTSTDSRRGFLSNNPSQNLGPLDDPLFLTVGGFALSVAGIIHNMVRGY